MGEKGKQEAWLGEGAVRIYRGDNWKLKNDCSVVIKCGLFPFTFTLNLLLVCYFFARVHYEQ